MPALLALASAATFGVADFLGGQATRRANVLAVTLFTNIAGLAVAVVLLALVGGGWSTGSVGWGALGGLFGLGGLVLLYSGLAIGPNKVVSPLSAVVAAVVPVVAGIALGDRPDRWAILGLLITPVAVWLVAGGELGLDNADRRPVFLAVGGGLGFGLFFTVLAQVPDGSGAVPLLAARAVSVTVLVIAVLVARPAFPRGRWRTMALTGGSLDMTANGLFLWSTRGGELAIVGALVSLYPASTVLLAVITLDERLSRSQGAGLALAIGAAALLS
ncbi:MAG: EamA family transporter [Acidimicrobiia bacterium]|nr:EamA family transporter [Acidimicrobiia bacterium]